MTPLFSPLLRLWRAIGNAHAILPILASICIVSTGNALLTTAVSLHLSHPDTDPHAVQAVLTAFPVGFLVGCLVAKSLVDRFGHERTFQLVALLATIATLGFALTGYLPVWFALRLFNGLSMAALFIVSESWINLYADHRNRGTYFGLYMLMTSLGVLFGQVLVGLGGPQSEGLFLIATVTTLAGVAYSRVLGGRWPVLPERRLAAQVEAASSSDQPFGLWKLALIAPVTIIGVLQAGTTNMNVFAMTPIYGVQVGLPTATTIALVTTFSIGGLLAQPPIGWLSDRIDRRLILLVQGVLVALLCGMIAWAGNRFTPLLFVLFFVYGAVALTIYPVAIAFANAQLESRFMVSVSGGLLLLYSLGNIATPGIAAGLMDRFAPQALFLMLGSGALLMVLAACFNLLRRPVAAAVVADPQPDPVPVGANK
jgi:MFS family permease